MNPRYETALTEELRLVRLDLMDARNNLKRVQQHIYAIRKGTGHEPRVLPELYKLHARFCDSVWKLQQRHAWLLLDCAKEAGAGYGHGAIGDSVWFTPKSWYRFVRITS